MGRDLESRPIEGIVEGMSVRQAQRTCPDAVVISADYAAYRQVSEQFLDILTQYSPLVEPDSLGSAYLDVTASRVLFGDASDIASRIASAVRERLDLPVSIGIAENKLLARVASFPVPEGGLRAFVAAVSTAGAHEFLASLPISVLDSVTPKIEKRLGELGVSTIGRLAMIPERLLVRQFGPVGSLMKRQSLGEDWSHVRAAYPPEVIIIEHAFEHSLEEPPEVETYLALMVDEALAKLRKRSCLASEITLGIWNWEFGIGNCAGRRDGEISKFQIPNSKSQSAFFRFKKPTDSASAMLQALGKMLSEKMQPGMEVSGVRIVLSDLTPGASSQLCLIGKGESRLKIDRTIELIRERFGDRAILIASSLAPTGRAGVLARIAA